MSKHCGDGDIIKKNYAMSFWLEVEMKPVRASIHKIDNAGITDHMVNGMQGSHLWFSHSVI